MNSILNRWFKKYFTDPEGLILALLLFLGFVVVILFGDMLAPLLVSAVLAYLLEGLVLSIERRGIKRIYSVLAVFLPFFTVFVMMFLGLIPLLAVQIVQLFQDLPSMVLLAQQSLARLPEHYPQYINEAQLNELLASIRVTIATMGQKLVGYSMASLSSLLTAMVYVILVPVLIFFMLKDKHVIVTWFSNSLPHERGVAIRIWREMDIQLGNYVRGKFIEILIVGSVSYVVFLFLGLNYTALIAALVGLSVIVPYLGAAVVTLPIAVIAYFQWGFDSQFGYVILAYAVIQALDGNVLVPWLFSEAVNLHPIAIIAAVLVFGGFWGFWGVFFAIPLATLVKAVVDAWPRTETEAIK